jgi:tellurite resistance protein TehA-like permease
MMTFINLHSKTRNQLMLPISSRIFLLFFPACLGVLKQVIWGSQLTQQMLALGTFLFCIEQSRMAVKDLQQIVDAKKQIKDTRLNSFYQVTAITIIIELIGFYISSIWWGWGSILILISQVWFNLFASIKIQYSSKISIQAWKVTDRLPVLIADIVGLALVSLWMLQIGSDWIAWGLFGLVVVYGSVKLILRLFTAKSISL